MAGRQRRCLCRLVGGDNTQNDIGTGNRVGRCGAGGHAGAFDRLLHPGGCGRVVVCQLYVIDTGTSKLTWISRAGSHRGSDGGACLAKADQRDL